MPQFVSFQSFLFMFFFLSFPAGTMIPKSGGDYAYLDEAFGPLLAFLYMWSAFVVIMPTGNAITAITFAQYLMQPLWMNCIPPFGAVRLLAGVVICNYFNFFTTYSERTCTT